MSTILRPSPSPPGTPPGTPLGAAVAAPRRSFALDRWITLALLIVGYMGYYLCRQNFSVANPLLYQQLGLRRQTFADIASLGTLVYAVGKVLGGPLADARGGRLVFFVGLFGSAVATLLLGILGGADGRASVLALTVLWSANRLFQSAGWGGLLSVMSRWYRRRDYGTASGALSISYQLGGVVAGAVCAPLVSLGWRALFVGPALLLAGLGVLLLVLLRGSPAEAGHPALADEATADSGGAGPAGGGAGAGEEGPGSLAGRIARLLARPAFLMVCGLSFVLTMIRETFNTWLPTYFADLGTRASLASLKSTLFPLLGVVGTLLAGWLSDRVWRGRRGPIMTLFLVGGALSLLGLSRPAAVAAGSGLPFDLTVLLLTGATGFFILAPYSMAGGGVLALDSGGRQAAATAAGLLDGVGYLGATLAGSGVARLQGRSGWGASFALMAGGVLLSALLALALYLTVERRRPSGQQSAAR